MSQRQSSEATDGEQNAYLDIYRSEVNLEGDDICEAIQSILVNAFHIQKTIAYSFQDTAKAFSQLMQKVAERGLCKKCEDRQMKVEVLLEINEKNNTKQDDLRREIEMLKGILADRERRIEHMSNQSHPISRANSKKLLEENPIPANPSRQLHLTKGAELVKDDQPSGFELASNLLKKGNRKRKADEYEMGNIQETKKKTGTKKSKMNDDETKTKALQRVTPRSSVTKSPVHDEMTLEKFSLGKVVVPPPNELNPSFSFGSQKESVDKAIGRIFEEERRTPLSQNRYETDVTPGKEIFGQISMNKEEIKRQLTYSPDAKSKVAGFETIFSSSSNGGESDKGIPLNFGALAKPTEVSLGKPMSEDEMSRRLYIKATPVRDDSQKERKDRFQRQGFICAQCAEFNLADDGFLPRDMLCGVCANRRSNHPLNQTPELYASDSVFSPP
eukprot:TRINITY_DN10956_c0_g1_i1.p1 TRINITY_DN10956_c0_g1~~TRINITY_DN10956_c0_g1_i1.p1  ORF type:complete len:444 (+),score=73.81 TRINITY_DN10956_c0_g1_i1:49-1380(+)